jgi:hypothetical protein
MPQTRAQAKGLLTQAEMALYDDSRINGLRALDARALARRVERTRKLRDKARDQLQRQRLASRERSGSKRGMSGNANERSKRKVELLGDILKRFEGQLKRVGGLPVATSRTRPAKAVAKAVARPVPKPVAKGAAKRVRQAAGKPVAKAVPKASRKQIAAKPRISPEQALANTRALLEAKHEHDRQPPRWQALEGHHEHLPQEGFQSPAAAAKAAELHAAESRMHAIQGSIGSQDRYNQGKRDHR